MLLALYVVNSLVFLMNIVVYSMGVLDPLLITMGDPAQFANLGKGLHIAHLNVRSMFGGHRFDMLTHQIRTSNIGVFSLSETWLNESVPNNSIEIEGYNCVRADRSWEDQINTTHPKKGGGLACYLRTDIKFSDSKYAHLNKSSKDLEMLWISVSLENVRPIVIVIIYRPPQGSYVKCCDIISEAFDQANLKDNTDIFLQGDFNINFSDKTNPIFKELDFMTKSLGPREIINSPTRISFRDGQRTESAIDLIFTNSDFIAKASTLDINISDHLGVMVTRKKLTSKPDKFNCKGRSYRNYIKEDFQESLGEIDWAPFFDNNDPNWLWDFMYGAILQRIDKMCPLKTFRMDEFKEVWMTNEAIEAIRDKDRFLSRAKRSGKEEDWIEAKRVRNSVGRDIENLRSDFLKREQEASRTDPRKFWKNVASVIPSKKNGQSRIWLSDDVTKMEISPPQVADYINRFFTNVGPDLAKKHNAEWKYFGHTLGNSIGQFTTNIDEVLKLCKEISPMKSSGMDKLSSKVCKDAFMVLGNQLVHLFNCSLTRSIFPTAWKAAKVVPLFKGGAREEVGNFRPVSLLPLPGKMLEKIVHKHISKFWEENNFLTQNQGGFRKGHSTVSTIADLTDDLFKEINRGNTTLAAFVDLRKAFDTVNQNILCKKLEKAVIRSQILGWCTNYLIPMYFREWYCF